LLFFSVSFIENLNFSGRSARVARKRAPLGGALLLIRGGKEKNLTNFLKIKREILGEKERRRRKFRANKLKKTLGKRGGARRFRFRDEREK